MNFFIVETIGRLVAPRRELSCSWFLWRRLCRRLRERGRDRTRESGAFLLGHQDGKRARIVDFVLYDDLDPHSLDSGIVHFDGRYFGDLWALCEDLGLTVVADVHVHPGGAGQSDSDRAYPMISLAGHTALIVPHFAVGRLPRREIGIYRYKGRQTVDYRSRCRPAIVLSYRYLRSASMKDYSQHDSLHRVVKHAIDSGVARSIAEAESMFHGYRLTVEIGSSAAADPISQVALLTAVALGRRVFLGGVRVAGELSTDLATPLPLGQTLADAVATLGARPRAIAKEDLTIVIGGGPEDRREGFCIRTAAAGWRGGIMPIHSDVSPTLGPAMPLAGMLSAALAINEAYLFVNGDMPAAGRRVLGLSLWQPDPDFDWLAVDGGEPELTYLPSKLWLIGLGHLGQAYLWGLGILPYRCPEDLGLVLQDFDTVTPSTQSTSMLTEARYIGQKKTRVMAEWAERRGFVTSIYERRFDTEFMRQECEPGVALCGLDNAVGRRALDQVGFDIVVEAGLGKGHRDFRTIRLHTLPGSRTAAQLWGTTGEGETVEDRPAYARLVQDGSLDQCGMTVLAGKAVGAPFVGAVAATLVLSEVLRLLHDGEMHQMIDLDLLNLDQRIASRHNGDFSHLNPGFTGSI